MGHIDKRAVSVGDKKLTPPFSLELQGSGTLLECLELFRLVPGKRAVLLSRWNGKLVVAKLFDNKYFRASKSAQIEIGGSRLLAAANIPTAGVVYSGSAHQGRLQVVLFEYIHPSTKLSEVLNAVQGSIRYREYANKLIILIAKLHEAGLLHNDLHLNNFLVKKDILYAVDSSAVKKIGTGAPLDKKKSVNNLAVIFAQLNIQDQDLLMDVVTSYLSFRNWKNESSLISFLRTRIDKRRRWVTKRHLKKIFRKSSKTVCKKTFTSLTLCKREHYTPAMEAFLNDPEGAFDSPETIMLKNGNSTTVVRLRVDDLDLVVKRYNAKNPLRGFRHAFKKSYADRSWRSIHFLLRNRVATAKPIAMKEMRFGIFRRRSYLICEYIDGISALDYFKNPGFEDTEKLIRKVVTVLKKLELLMVRHGDMKASNIIIHQKTPYVIDLDSMVIHKFRFLFAHAHQKDVSRFMKNWVEHPRIAERFTRLI